MARRCLIRPPRPSPNGTNHRLQKLRSRLERERTSLTRWLARLKRAFHAFEKCQATIARLERQLTKLEE